ncbi:MAG: 30S ribosomal protein S3 [Candidatus Nasuia deltocephalinicola]
MARKINPFIFRVVNNKNWNSFWYTKKSNYSNYLLEDLNIRNYLEKFFRNKPFGKVIIFKNLKFIFINIYIKRIFYLKKNSFFFLKKNISFFTNKKIFLNFKNISNSFIDPKVIFFYIKRKIESRKSYKGFIKSVINNAFKFRCLGLKIVIQGRINGNVMTRKQTFFYGKIPLQKFCSNIRYHSGFCNTIYGCIGVKIWLYFGDYIY